MMIAFVEGMMERQFINRNFQYVHVISVQNGITWTVSQLCNQITTLYSAFDCRDEVVVWLDREKRGESAEEIGAAICSALTQAGADSESVHILINDRMSENIILADERVIRSEFGKEDYIYQYEGDGGKHILKEIHRDNGINYKEVVHGVSLLKKIRLSDCANRSPAVARFLSTFVRDCWWINAR